MSSPKGRKRRPRSATSKGLIASSDRATFSPGPYRSTTSRRSFSTSRTWIATARTFERGVKRLFSSCSAEAAQGVDEQNNQHDGPQPHTGASAGTPAAMAVVPAASAKQDHQDNQQNQHVRSIFLSCDPRPSSSAVSTDGRTAPVIAHICAGLDLTIPDRPGSRLFTIGYPKRFQQAAASAVQQHLPQ